MPHNKGTSVLYSLPQPHPPPHGATVPNGPGLPRYRGFTNTHTHTHTPHSVGLLWTSDQPQVEAPT